jgi:NAD+ synthase
MKFDKNILQIEPAAEVERICAFIRKYITEMRRDGAVIGMSGGVDSAVGSALCVRALGKDNVLGMLLPEKDSNPVSAKYATAHAKKLGVKTMTVDITPTLETIGTYQKQDEAIRRIFPEYNEHYKSKITLPADLLARDAFNVFSLTIEDGKGNIRSGRLDARTMHAIVAATNTKQRTRMLYLNYQSEKENAILCGTTNRTEDIQGFFVQHGDGGVDIEPIAHLYKMQVYQLASYLEVTRKIIERAPSPDTFSFVVTDEEFYFRIPYHILDPLLYAWEHKIPEDEVARAMELTEEQVKRAFRDFTSKNNATKHLRRLPPTLNP